MTMLIPLIVLILAGLFSLGNPALENYITMAQDSRRDAAGYNRLAALFLDQANRYKTKVLFRFWRAGRRQALTFDH